MGFFSNLRQSWNKSKKLRELQLTISPPNQNANDFVSDFMLSLKTGGSERDKALEQFLDLCESDSGVKQVMRSEGLLRSDLKEIYSDLLTVGLGQWIKGHYVALSTIAYVEPLLYIVRAKQRGTNRLEIAGTLLEYWENKISQGDLLNKV